MRLLNSLPAVGVVAVVGFSRRKAYFEDGCEDKLEKKIVFQWTGVNLWLEIGVDYI